MTEPRSMASGAYDVRAAGPSDLDGMVSVDRLAAAGQDARVRYLEAAMASDGCLVCERDGTIAGLVVTRGEHFFGRDFVELLLVHPDHRRVGIGRHLLRQAVAAARTRHVFTSTNRSNVGMQRLLVSEGWTLRGEVDGLDDGDPEVFFSTARP